MTKLFDRSQARLALEICRYTYAVGAGGEHNQADREDAQNSIQQHSSPVGEPVEIQDQSGTSFACVVPYADRNVVSYMGTETEFDIKDLRQFLESLADWGQNGRAVPTEFTLEGKHLGKPSGVTLPGKVHRGFLSQLKAVQADVVGALDHWGGRQRSVLITGHSQGGAEAALATAALAVAGFRVEVTYTFAAPRSGTVEFANAVATPVHRFEFGDDIVPHLPPTLIRHMLEDTLKKQIEPLPAPLEKPLRGLLQRVLDSMIDVSYVGLGTLCYGRQDEQRLHADLEAAAEQALFASRLASLSRHPTNWAEHHHLAGTTAEVDRGERGNYTALADIWPLA